jgi:hypothetical protein
LKCIAPTPDIFISGNHLKELSGNKRNTIFSPKIPHNPPLPKGVTSSFLAIPPFEKEGLGGIFGEKMVSPFISGQLYYIPSKSNYSIKTNEFQYQWRWA